MGAFVEPSSPDFFFWADLRRRLPKEEVTNAEHIYLDLQAMAGSVFELHACVVLFESADERSKADRLVLDYEARIHHAWQLLAARQGAIVINGVWKAMEAISKRLLNRCPTLISEIDMGLKKEAMKRFEAAFPGISEVRHDAAHLGEFTSTPEMLRRNSIGGIDSPQIYIGGCIQRGNEYICTVKGNVVSYRLEEGSVAALCSVVNLMVRALEKSKRPTPI